MNQVKESFKVDDTLAAYRIVACGSTTAETVAYPATLQDLPIGVTLDTVLDTTCSIPVALSGIAKVYFNDSVVLGGLVASDSSGRGVPVVLANTTSSLTLAAAYVGVLIGAKVNDTGSVSNIVIHPGFDRVAG